MTPLVCRSCGATWLSDPAAALMKSRDRTCLRCDGEVEWESDSERIVRQHFVALNNGDEQALAETLDPAVVVCPAVPVAAMGLPAAMRGIPAVLAGVRSLKEDFTGWCYDVRAIDEHDGGCVICEGSVSVTAVHGGSEAPQVFWVIRLRDGRIVEKRGFDHPDAARRALEVCKT